METGLAIAGWVLAPLGERLVSLALSNLGSCSSDNLKNLEIDTQLLKGILQAADARIPGDKLEPWIKKLRSAYSEAEDILDVIDYHRIENQILSQKHTKSATTVSLNPFKKRKAVSSSNTAEDLSIPQESKTKLKEALDKIRDLVTEGRQLLSRLNLHASCENIKSTPSSSSATPMTTTSAPPAYVFGRDKELRKIIEDLRDSPAPGKCYTTVGIHGLPGSGKTTLAQHVLKKESEEESFDVIMWIHVTQTFSEVNVLNEMLEIASGMKRVNPEQSNLDKLQRDLTEKLKGKRFFLVLDDVWYKGRVTEQKLEQILYPFKDGKIGSRILLTSRGTDVAAALRAKSNPISDLEEKEYLSMFMYYAIHGATLSEQELRQYNAIGEKIAKKLRRSPLAAATVASQLRQKPNTDDWIDVMESDLLEDTMGALIWSYQQLDENIKQCFRYCSIFPRRYELRKDELVRLWIAQGLVKTTSDTEDMEKVAKDYFHVLVSSSFIQPKQNTSIYANYHFTIHDLLHDLAEYFARSDCFQVKEGMIGQIPSHVQHIFIESGDPKEFVKEIVKLKALRTLIMSPNGPTIHEQQFVFLLRNLKKLRVLHVRFEGVEKVPECIGELKHLRSFSYWGFASNKDVTLPPEFTKLYHLQGLHSLHNFDLYDSAIEEMANLVNLRYFDTGRPMFPNIGRMTWLRTLRHFEVMKKRGFEIHQLGSLNKLCGNLTITGLEVVKSEDALQASLYKKVHLSHLSLQWFPYSRRRDIRVVTSHDTQAEVFEALSPPFMVESLCIGCYQGSKYPSWLLEKGDLGNLQELKFHECATPPMTLLGCLYLRTLGISDCKWYSMPENMLQGLESLRILHIDYCYDLKSLPELPESLELLEIDNCPKLEKSYEMGGSSWEKIQRTTTIKISNDLSNEEEEEEDEDEEEEDEDEDEEEEEE